MYMKLHIVLFILFRFTKSFFEKDGFFISQNNVWINNRNENILFNFFQIPWIPDAKYRIIFYLPSRASLTCGIDEEDLCITA